MEITIKGNPKEIADLVLAVQSRHDDSQGEYEVLKERISRDLGAEITQMSYSPLNQL